MALDKPDRLHDSHKDKSLFGAARREQMVLTSQSNCALGWVPYRHWSGLQLALSEGMTKKLVQNSLLVKFRKYQRLAQLLDFVDISRVLSDV